MPGVSSEHYVWVIPAIFSFLVVAFGCGILFFADHLMDYAVRWLQSRPFRLAVRASGVLFVGLGLLVAWAFMTGMLH
jgi:threonine/homoserine/homoserine lactone efflux protein